MKEVVGSIQIIIGGIIGLLILLGVADIKLLAWFYVITAAVLLLALVTAGVAVVIATARGDG